MNHMSSTLSPEQIEVVIEQEKNIAIKFVLLQQLADATAAEGNQLLDNGDTSAAEGKFEYAKQKYVQALQIARKMRNKELEYNILSDLGSTEEKLQKTDLAFDSYEQALKIALKMEDFIAQSEIYYKLGALFWRIGDFDRANEYLNLSAEAAEIAELSPINVEKEQTASRPTPKIPSRGSRLTSTIRKSVEISNEIKELKRLRAAQQRRAIIVDILLVIVLIILRDIFSNGAFSLIPFFIFSFFIIVAGGILTYLAFVPSSIKGKLRTRQARKMRQR